MVKVKKTQRIELLNSIRENIVAFLAITVFVMFGAALYSGISWSGQALKASVAEEQNVGNMADIELLFPYGFDEDDMTVLRSVDGVKAIEGAYSAFEKFKINGEVCIAKIIMAGDNINRLTQIEGILPQRNNEIAIEKSWALEKGIKIGDTVSFAADGENNAHFLHNVAEGDLAALLADNRNEMKYLTNRVFTVTALAVSPAYIDTKAAVYEISPSMHTPASCLMFVHESAFDSSSFTGYTTVFIKSSETDGQMYGTEEYNDIVAHLKERILPIAEEIANRKFGELNSGLEAFREMLPPTVVATELSNVGVNAVTHQCNPSIAILKTVCDMFDTLKYNLSIPFIFISILISYSTISRIVYKDMRYIGTKKALGFKNSSIIINYILFAGMAAFIGLVSGFLISRFVIEQLFLNTLGKSFLFNKKVFCFSVKDTVILSALQLGFIVLSAFVAGCRTVRKPIIELLSNDEQNETKKHFFEKSRMWKRMPFLSKIIVKNCLNDKRRVAATLIGISGCTALAICGTSLMFSVFDSFDYHFSHLQDYRYVVYFDNTYEDVQDEIEKKLAKMNADYSPVLYSYVRLNSSTGKDVVATLAVSDCDFNGLMKIVSLDGKENALSDSGAWINCAFALSNGINEKDSTITFTDAANNIYTVQCAGVYEFYMQFPCLAMSATAYEKTVGVKPEINAFVVASDDMDKIGIETALEDIPGFLAVYDYRSVMQISFNEISGVASAIAVLYLVLSILMAPFILLDLFVLFVEEKKRELIVIMLNGYKRRFAKKYISCDAVFLTFVGILLGIVEGVMLGRWNIDRMTSDVSYFLHRINILTCIGAAGLSSLLTAFICHIAIKRISGFQLSNL